MEPANIFHSYCLELAPIHPRQLNQDLALIVTKNITLSAGKALLNTRLLSVCVFIPV